MGQFPSARHDVLLRRIGSEWVLFDTRQDRAHVLNLTAAIVWTYLDGTTDADTIAEAMAREVTDSEPRAVRADVARLVRRFADEGLLA